MQHSNCTFFKLCLGRKKLAKSLVFRGRVQYVILALYYQKGCVKNRSFLFAKNSVPVNIYVESFNWSEENLHIEVICMMMVVPSVSSYCIYIW